MNELIQMLSFPFIVRAIAVGIPVSLCAALLGVTLVLRRYSMIGDGLSHVGFGALAIAAALNMSPLKITIPIVILAAFFLLKITQNSKVKADSAIALISTGSLAIGVMIISLTSGINTDLNNYLFGSILSTNNEDMVISLILSTVVLILFILFYNKIFSITFDEVFAKATGINADFYNILIALLTAVTIVIGMRLMGSMLISALIIFPALTSMRLFKSFFSVTLSSAIISIVCFIIGIIISYFYSTPTGASVVLANIILFVIASFISFLEILQKP